MHMRPDIGIHPFTSFAKSNSERDTMLLNGQLGGYGDIRSNGDDNNVEDDNTPHPPTHHYPRP